MAGSLLLTLDTATTAGSVALSRGEQLLGEVLTDTVATHSDRLLIQARQLLTDLGVELMAVDAIAVVNGPGSFTGLRVGIATAKGLAVACRCPLIGVSSLEALAASLPFSPVPVCALLDARKKEVYAACFDTSYGMLHPLDEPRAVTPEQLLATLAAPTLFVGSGAVAYAELIRHRLGSHALFAPWPLHTPRASCAASVALQRLRCGKEHSPASLLPRYLRPSEAELNLSNIDKTAGNAAFSKLS